MRAVDPLGNTDPTPAARSFSVDTTRSGGAGGASAAVLGRVASVKGRRALLRIRCSGAAGTRCAGRVLIQVKLRLKGRRRLVTIAAGRYALASGQTRRVKVKLNRRGSRLLRRGGSRGLRVRASGPGLRARSLKLRSAGKRR